MTYIDYTHNHVPQGWECPKCKRVYSPATPMCYNCGGETTTTTSNLGSIPNITGVVKEGQPSQTFNTEKE